MAGGGVGEAMLIGAAVGAGTGGIMSAAQDKDVGQGMLLGALGGAATGGIGSGIGGAAADVAQNIGTSAVETGVENAAANTAAQSVGDAALNQFSTAAADQAAQQAAQQTTQQAATNAVANTGGNFANASTLPTGAAPLPGGGSFGATGASQVATPGLTTAERIGAGTTGGISGLMAANGQPAPYQAPETETYNGPLSKFKLAGPSLSQYNYDPNTFQPSVAPGYAEGGIASLAQGGVQQTGMFPQSQMDRTQFAIPSQMPVSREIIDSDYDAAINPYTGDLPRFAEGGGINFIHNLQPGGEFGDMTADIYGAVQEHKPKWLQDMEPGGFIGATVPGKLDWEEKKRKEEEEKIAQDRAAKEAKAAAMYNQMAGGNPQAGGGMARGGIADLGSYSDGGRLLRGPGDGMSDDIPATIAGKQPARLADGEFVVPADVVSHLGNGSTDAGAKTLYSMMDKVRKARTGSKKQGRDINPDKYVPKMARGGIACLAEGGETEAPKETAQTVEVPQGYTPSVYNPAAYNYSAYTQSHRPSGDAPQYYGDIYRGESPDYATPGYTLTGGNLGRWSNVAGEAQRAAQPASLNQQVTQAYLQNIGRVPDQTTFNAAMQSGLTGQQINKAIQSSPASGQVNPNAYISNLYQNVLGRDPDQGGYDYWTSQLSQGKQTPEQILNAFQASPEFLASNRPKQQMFADPYAVQQLQTNKAPTVRAKTVQDLIDESLAKYKADNPTYTPSSYNMDSGGVGGGGGGERAGGVIKAKRRGGIASLT